MPNTGPERAIENDAINRLTALGFQVEWLTNRRRQGWPDLTVMWGERLIYVEVKAPGGKLRANQKREREYQIKCGRRVIVSDDADEIVDLVCKWRNGKLR